MAAWPARRSYDGLVLVGKGPRGTISDIDEPFNAVVEFDRDRHR